MQRIIVPRSALSSPALTGTLDLLPPLDGPIAFVDAAGSPADVAEQATAELGLDAFHRAFTEQWRHFLPWIGQQLAVETMRGADDILDTYRIVLAGGLGPETAKVLTW